MKYSLVIGIVYLEVVFIFSGIGGSFVTDENNGYGSAGGKRRYLALSVVREGCYKVRESDLLFGNVYGYLVRFDLIARFVIYEFYVKLVHSKLAYGPLCVNEDPFTELVRWKNDVCKLIGILRVDLFKCGNGIGVNRLEYHITRCDLGDRGRPTREGFTLLFGCFYCDELKRGENVFCFVYLSVNLKFGFVFYRNFQGELVFFINDNKLLVADLVCIDGSFYH